MSLHQAFTFSKVHTFTRQEKTFQNEGTWSWNQTSNLLQQHLALKLEFWIYKQAKTSPLAQNKVQ